MNRTQSFYITSENIKHNCFDFIADKPVGEGFLVTIKDKKETRSGAQNKLRWVWMTFLEKELMGQGVGRSKEDWNRYFKGKFLRGLLISQDEEYSEFYNQADALIYDAPNPDFAKKVLLDNVHTEWLKVKNMAEFMDSIDRYCSYDLNIILPLPDDLKWLCENGSWKV